MAPPDFIYVEEIKTHCSYFYTVNDIFGQLKPFVSNLDLTLSFSPKDVKRNKKINNVRKAAVNACGVLKLRQNRRAPHCIKKLNVIFYENMCLEEFIDPAEAKPHKHNTNIHVQNGYFYKPTNTFEPDGVSK